MRGRICGTGSYIPEHYYDNNDLAKFVETNDEWIRERTGIVRRHIAEEDTTVSMAIKAAKNALTDAKLNADDLDLILVSTITPNTVIPSTACEVQKELGAVNATCFDISAACSMGELPAEDRNNDRIWIRRIPFPLSAHLYVVFCASL